MNSSVAFSPAVTEQLKYYVYLLIDPRTDRVFYVGKGTGNRIFAHLTYALTQPLETDKLDRIREIRAAGMEVRHVIHRHGLTEEEAFEVEAALIDYIGLEGLTNLVNGQDSNARGPMTIEEIATAYDAPILEITDPVMLIIVNRLYRRGMNEVELYEITRGNWVVGKRREKAKYAMAVYNGIVRQVYRIERWFPVHTRDSSQKTRDRWRLEGAIAPEMQYAVGGSVERYLARYAQNPIRYVNA